ncbi:DUF3244 domain-containing protein [Lutibacter sp. A80]|uniref:DUF3244 domain-containing protein n=1 Tax=Lutibacter sp. A80 TaxID=2918453 RepID=UPI001F05785F|nr:DUF3244 domain-containing protein [Lutibacter sp. A80]UMB60108.1 DUF3244 domain-containing protein [Lutibacter sp. A80]
MKNLIKKSLLLVVVLTTAVISATNINKDLDIKVSTIDSKLIDLRLKNSDRDLTISVKDTYGEVLYSEEFEGVYFSKKYDLNILPTGNYYFEIEGATKINLMPFTVTSRGFEFKNEVKSTYYKPIVRQDGDLVYISKVAFNKENFEINLYDDESNLLYKELLNGEVNLGKAISLEELRSGSYKLVTKSAGKIFEQSVYKK